MTKVDDLHWALTSALRVLRRNRSETWAGYPDPCEWGVEPATRAHVYIYIYVYMWGRLLLVVSFFAERRELGEGQQN